MTYHIYCDMTYIYHNIHTHAHNIYVISHMSYIYCDIYMMCHVCMPMSYVL